MRVRARLSIGVANAARSEVIEIPDDDLEGLDDKSREQRIQEYVDNWSQELIDLGWEEVE